LDTNARRERETLHTLLENVEIGESGDNEVVELSWEINNQFSVRSSYNLLESSARLTWKIIKFDTII